jgi:hypothetical protein
MENNKRFLLLLMLLPWLSVPFLGKKSFKRFSLAAMLISVVFAIQSVISHRRGWWRVYPKLIPNVIGEFPFIVGPFYVGAMWILKFTYGKFFRYLLLNLGVDFFHIYIFVTWLKSQGIAALIRLKNYQALLLFKLNAILMYGFQTINHKKINQKKPKTLLKRIFS